MQIKFGLASILPETKVFGYIEADAYGDVIFTEADEEPVITTTHSVGPVSISETRPAGEVLAYKTSYEIQSNHDRLKWATGLIRQLPKDHEGAASWLLNYAADGKSMTVPDGIVPPTGLDTDMTSDQWEASYHIAVNAVAKSEERVVLLEARLDSSKHSEKMWRERYHEVSERLKTVAVDVTTDANKRLKADNAALTEERDNAMKLLDGEKSRVSYLVEENMKLRAELKARPEMDYAESLAKERDEANAATKRLNQIILRTSAEMREVREQLRKATAERDNAREGNSKYFCQVNGLETDVKRLTDDVRHYEKKSEDWMKAYQALRVEFEGFIAAARNVANQTPSAMVMGKPKPMNSWGRAPEPPKPVGYQPLPPAPAPFPPQPLPGDSL